VAPVRGPGAGVDRWETTKALRPHQLDWAVRGCGTQPAWNAGGGRVDLLVRRDGDQVHALIRWSAAQGLREGQPPTDLHDGWRVPGAELVSGTNGVGVGVLGLHGLRAWASALRDFAIRAVCL